MHNKVVIIGGGGMVGSAAAQAIIAQGVFSEILLIDENQSMNIGQAIDLDHSTAHFHGARVSAGSYSEINNGDIVVITCGAAQKRGQTRLELTAVNAAILKEVTTKVIKSAPDVYILVVTNPVDVMTHVVLEASGLPRTKVIGSGTTLDTARLRKKLSDITGYSQSNIQAYVFGEHGDSSFIARSTATIEGMPIVNLSNINNRTFSNLNRDIRSSAYKIIEAKNSTYYGIASVIAEITKAMIHPKGRILATCMLAKDEFGVKDTVLGLPCVVSSEGANIVKEYPFSTSDIAKLHQSADIIRQHTKTVIK